MAGGGGCLQGGVLKGSERPEAGCLGEYDQGFWVRFNMLEVQT